MDSRNLHPSMGGSRQPQNGYGTNERSWRRDDPRGESRERHRDDRQHYSSSRSQTRDPYASERERSRGGTDGRSRSRQNGTRNGKDGTKRLDGKHVFRWCAMRKSIADVG